MHRQFGILRHPRHTESAFAERKVHRSIQPITVNYFFHYSFGRRWRERQPKQKLTFTIAVHQTGVNSNRSFPGNATQAPVRLISRSLLTAAVDKFC